jgi:hypothetical protein
VRAQLQIVRLRQSRLARLQGSGHLARAVGWAPDGVSLRRQRQLISTSSPTFKVAPNPL